MLPSIPRVVGGLSPRLRGNLMATLATLVVSRSIPAPAGEPTLVNLAAVRREVYPRACGGT